MPVMSWRGKHKIEATVLAALRPRQSLFAGLQNSPQQLQSGPTSRQSAWYTFDIIFSSFLLPTPEERGRSYPQKARREIFASMGYRCSAAITISTMRGGLATSKCLLPNICSVEVQNDEFLHSLYHIWAFG